MSGSRYWEGPEGRHYAYSVDASYECPVGKMASAVQRGDETQGRLVLAADALGISAKVLARLLSKSSCGSRARDDERLTDRCVAHDCKMRKRGYRAFIDEPVPEAEWDETHRLSVSLNRAAFDPDYVPRRVVEQRWCDTKREARQWAWTRCDKACAAARVSS